MAGWMYSIGWMLALLVRKLIFVFVVANRTRGNVV